MLHPDGKIHADDAASAGYASHIRNNREAMHPGSAAPFLPEADVLLQKGNFHMPPEHNAHIPWWFHAGYAPWTAKFWFLSQPVLIYS